VRHNQVLEEEFISIVCLIAVALHNIIPFSFGFFSVVKEVYCRTFIQWSVIWKLFLHILCANCSVSTYVLWIFFFPCPFLPQRYCTWVSRQVCFKCVCACVRHSCRLRVVVKILMMIILGLSALGSFILLLMMESYRWLFLFWWFGISTGPLKLIWIRHINFYAKLIVFFFFY
jgi:hypothetical protein